MNIANECKAYASIYDYDRLVQLLTYAQELSPEEIAATIPSIKLATDGPALASIFIVTKNMLGEIRVSGTSYDIDFVNINTVQNYRISSSEHTVDNADGTKISYQIAKVKFVHSLSSTFTSEFEYVGMDRKAWLAKLMKTIPISILCQ